MRLVSPCQPSRITVTSMLTMSPSCSSLVAGNAVADDVVDRGADRLREAAIVERRRHRAVADDEVVAQPVQLAGGDAGLHVGRDEVERLGGEPAGLAHAVEGLGAVDLDAAGLVAPFLLGRFLHFVPRRCTLQGFRSSQQMTSNTVSNKWLCRRPFSSLFIATVTLWPQAVKIINSAGGPIGQPELAITIDRRAARAMASPWSRAGRFMFPMAYPATGCASELEETPGARG